MICQSRSRCEHSRQQRIPLNIKFLKLFIIIYITTELRPKIAPTEVANKDHEHGTICRTRRKQLMPLRLGEHRHRRAEEQREDNENTDGVKSSMGALTERGESVHSDDWEHEQNEDDEGHDEADEELDAG